MYLTSFVHPNSRDASLYRELPGGFWTGPSCSILCLALYLLHNSSYSVQCQCGPLQTIFDVFRTYLGTYDYADCVNLCSFLYVFTFEYMA